MYVRREKWAEKVGKREIPPLSLPPLFSTKGSAWLVANFRRTRRSCSTENLFFTHLSDG